MVRIDTEKLASELFNALKGRYCLDPLTNRYPEISIDEAYSISLKLLEKRLKEGEKVIGKKDWRYFKSCSRDVRGRSTRFWFFNFRHAHSK